ncbi:hypothetical protein [Dapis sp. BLCC M229]|uniref:hypothetical protein n=1 Tax=Dapis sp. BLCC M229 TaxID=3400188 RepID=UPI003CFA58C4
MTNLVPRDSGGKKLALKYRCGGHSAWISGVGQQCLTAILEACAATRRGQRREDVTKFP